MVCYGIFWNGQLFYHSITEFVIFRKLPSRSNDRDHINKQGASMVSFTHEQNSICSQKLFNNIVHEHTIICRQLLSGDIVGSWPMKRKKHLHQN